MLIPRLCWPLLIYKISFSVVKCLESLSYLRRWHYIHHFTTNICPYSSTSPCPLPLKSLTSVIKSTKVSGHLLLTESADQKILESASQLKCCSCGMAQRQLLMLKVDLNFKLLLDIINHLFLGINKCGWCLVAGRGS